MEILSQALIDNISRNTSMFDSGNKHKNDDLDSPYMTEEFKNTIVPWPKWIISVHFWNWTTDDTYRIVNRESRAY